ncbi:MAG: MBL fold metallo-hydrolase [Holophaga sp.]|nr:MBL fold metallo-hydrolase [Holophaga sp.]
MKQPLSMIALALVVPMTLVTHLACSNSSNNGLGSSATPTTQTNKRVAGMVIGSPVVLDDANGNPVLSTSIMTTSGLQTVNAPLTSDKLSSQIAALQLTLVQGNLVDWLPVTTSATAQVPADPSQAFQVILSKGSSAAAQFVLANYGPSVHIDSGVPGAMVAAGWVYGTTTGTTPTITIGDGKVVSQDLAGVNYATPIKRYEMTYNVDPNAKVFNVNTTDYTKSTVSTLSSIPLTAYGDTVLNRQAAYLVFDRNYKNATNAKVVGIWYFTPQSTVDGFPAREIPVDSSMIAQYGNDANGKAYTTYSYQEPSSVPFERSTEPFEIVKDTMYYVGDNECASYIFKCNMGYPNDSSKWKIIKLDAGWPNSGYQYFKNMELVGIDPRSVTDLWLTHGHIDHYGTAVEQLHMMDNAGLPITLWGSEEDTFGVTSDLQGNTWNIAGALPTTETEIRARTSKTFTFDQWYDFGNVQVMVIWSPGHTPGTTNMIYKVKNPVDGTWITFGYHGGYGFNGLYKPTAADGWLRLDFQHGFSYLQENYDTDYVSPQHTDQYPIVETYQALKAYNRANPGNQLTMLDALSKTVSTSGANGNQITVSEFQNQLEKRRSVISYKATDTTKTPVGNYQSIETSGPFKPGRDSGLTNVTATVLDGGKIVEGFNKYQNVNPKIPLIANGIAMSTDGYVHDPTGFYVQVYIDVQDSTYKGYLPDGYTPDPGTNLVTGLANPSITYSGGPIESIHPAKGTYHPPEVLRTQRLSSLSDAQAILATLTKGKSYTISLTKASEIVVPTTVTNTFVAKAE